MVSGGSERYLESLLEALCFILTEYEPISIHGESICVDFDLQGCNSVIPNIQKTKIFFGIRPLSDEGNGLEFQLYQTAHGREPINHPSPLCLNRALNRAL